MWYLASLLFAQRARPVPSAVACETSQVLLEADTAVAAHEKAIAWADRHRQERPGFELVGVQQLRKLGEEPPRDGDEIDGRVWESDDVWSRAAELIPPRDSLAAVYLEENPEARLSDVLSPDERRLVERILTEP